MGLLYDLAKKYRTLSIVGMAKNAGKTTALNYLVEEADDESIRIGVTSTGRDGETVDLVTNTEKPKVYLYEDTIVSVPTSLFDFAEASLEIISMSRARTSIGELLLCRVCESGYVQIAGPVATADTKKLCMKMFDLGAELILIDGAIDRKSIASPDTSDAIILSTGAVLSRDMKKVVQDTAHIVHLYQLPLLEDQSMFKLLQDSGNLNQISVIEGDKVIPLELKTGLGAGRYINEAIRDDTDAVYIPGAVTKNVIDEIDNEKFKNTRFILKDPTKIFIDSMTWRRLLKRGLKVNVLKNIEVAAITVNPYAPEGYSFDSTVLCEFMQEALPEMPVIDVRK